MALRMALECCISPSPVSSMAAPAPHSSPSSLIPKSYAASTPMHGAVQCSGISSRSSRSRRNDNSNNTSSNRNTCSFLTSLEGHLMSLPRRYFPPAAFAPPSSNCRGECGQHFAALAFKCERKQSVASAPGAAAVRSAKGFMVFEMIRAKFEGSNFEKFKRRRNIGLVVNAEKKKGGGISFGDQLLDYIEGGPKLRRWYGAPDQLRKDGKSEKIQDFEEPEEEEADVVRDAVLVTDADSDTGQLVVLELILRRLRVLALVKDIKAATIGFGAYVQPVEGDVNDRTTLKKIIKSVRAIVCPAKVGQLADNELVRGVEHLVLLSKLAVNRNQGGLGSLFGRRSRREAEENEAAVSSSGIPYTIVRAGSLNDERGGDFGFRYGQGGEVDGTIRREDAAYVCAEALDSPPRRALVFEVVNGTDEVEDWSAVFASMKERVSEGPVEIP